VLLAIAKDEAAAHFALISEVTDCIFAPYAGGADGFSFDTEFLQRLADAFSPWPPLCPAHNASKIVGGCF
jgi:hypothetical protein